MNATVSKRKWVERAWYAVSALYSLFRVILADHTVTEYGVNIWVFAIVEFGATVPYAIGTARVVTSLLDHDRPAALRWALVASAGFFAPDIYTLAAARSAPWWISAVIVTWMTVAAVIAVRSLRSNVRQRRAAAGASTGSLAGDLEAQHGGGHRDIEALGPAGVVDRDPLVDRQLGVEAVGFVAQDQGERPGEVGGGVR
jgi:hypothetical protein